MTRFGMSEEGQWGYRRVKAVLGNGDHHGRVRDWCTWGGRRMENTKELW